MARRYSRREFLTDASFTFAAAVLLQVLAPSRIDDGMEKAAVEVRQEVGKG